MTLAELSLVFGFGLASSVHCLGMCGPIVLSYSVGLPGPSLNAHLAYNAGRILTYMLLGAIAGAAGKAIGLLGELAGFASGARIFAGAAMVVAGALMIGLFPAKPLIQIQTLSITRRFTRVLGGWLLGVHPHQKFLLGLSLGFLPCGLIYAALLKALESAGAVAGALTMLAFGLGTASALLAVGLVSPFIGVRLGRWTNRFAALCVLVFGAILLWRGIAAHPMCHD